MFGAFIRAAVAFAGAMLFSTVLKEVLLSGILPGIGDALGKQHLLYQSLDGVQYWLPALVVLALVIGLIARGLTEQQLPG